MIKRLLLFVFISFSLIGCATIASGPLFVEAPKAPKGMGTVYVFRTDTSKMYGMAVAHTAYINDKPFLKLYRGGYSFVHLKPGIYKFSAGLETEFVIEDGETKFIESFSGGTRLREYEKSAGLKVVKQCRYIEPLNTNF